MLLATMSRSHFTIRGIVQGVGFRPFVFRLASELGLSGWVRNNPAGVEIEVQGFVEIVQAFEKRLLSDLPPLAQVSNSEQHDMPELVDESGFLILPSSGGRPDVQIAPDTALCADCLRELFDPADRRFLHPFITCTNCGPRWTILTGIPYDRPLTTMAGFALCLNCEAEYCNPLDRRFHAQPIACPQCGPRLSLIPGHLQPLEQAASLLRQGLIVAVKGLGGYHLAVDAGNDAAVTRLRQRKLRDEKPFAVMVPDMKTARLFAELSAMEEKLLAGPEAPVVIVRKRDSGDTIPNQKADSGHVPIISPQVAPGSQWIGLMLAYTPLHHLLFQGPDGQKLLSNPGPRPLIPALVMTSANRSDEPMIADDKEALEQLSGIADAWLAHDRQIHVRTDDSVLRVFQGAPIFYRRSRGFVPRPVRLPFDADQILALGAELKNTVCLTRGSEAFLSQHIGDLKNEATFEACRETVRHLCGILEVAPRLVACDLHPDLLSTRLAEDVVHGVSGQSVPPRLVRVQHHHAHLAACMAENGLEGTVTGVIFDGTGLGEDGTVWGGEFLVGGYTGVQRAGHLKQVRLPGGDAAAREPWRMALSWLYEIRGTGCFELDLPLIHQIPETARPALRIMLERGLNAPFTSSVGRLFDAVVFLLGIGNTNNFDGQAAMALEAFAERAGDANAVEELPFFISQPTEGPFQLDPAPMICSLLELLSGGVAQDQLALAFHRALAQAVAAGCTKIRTQGGPARVVLSGGVFQNRLLTELVYTSLLAAGFQVFIHRLVPPNDGGLALGQAAIAAHTVF